MKIDTDDIVDSGSLAAGPEEYVIIRKHLDLQAGDVVLVRYVRGGLVLVRLRDYSVFTFVDGSGQWPVLCRSPVQ
jgi:hypothetical protein